MSADNKHTVVVTGGSRGIGRAICLAFAAPDTRIFFSYAASAADADKTMQLAADAGGFANGVRADSSQEADIQHLFQTVLEATGRVDVLVNNAGISRDGLLVRMKTADWENVLSTNLTGAFACMKLASKTMLKQRQGRIINIASVVAATGNPGQANYAASKAGLIGLTKSAARELASRNITVNAIAPGFIETDMTASLPEKVRSAMLEQIPLGRAGTPEDVAAVARFLASDQAQYITGQVIHVSGGMYM